MSDTATTLDSIVRDGRFPSLASLRVAHSELLKRHREQGDQPEVQNEIAQLIHKGRATGALLDCEDDRWAAQSLLDYWSSLLYRAGQEPPDATLVDFDPSLAPDLSDDLCPYVGLEAFREKNQNLFFGRQRLIDKLIKHLESNQLLIVVGSSGSGKSSVVLGGLIPQLIAGAIPISQDWFYYPTLVPGSDPLAALAKRLKPTDVSASEWISKQVPEFKKNANHLVQLTGQSKHQPVVLVIDQFEEVFTLCSDYEAQQAFISNLLNFIGIPGVRNTLILTMRSDFESQVARVPTLQGSFESASVRVTALDAAELREAIEKPAELVGLKFEEGLVDALLNDVLGEPAALPLLQFTLLKLWDHRERNRITWKAYRELGGGRQSLSNSADQFYDNLIYEDQITAKRILLKLVRPTEGLEVTSNRISRKDLYLAGEAKDRVDRVLDRLIEARLIRQTEGDTPDDAQVEVAHEAMIRNWARLVGWLDDERVRLRQRLHLKALAEQWQTRAHDRNLLLRGDILKEAQQYDDLTGLERDFIQSSQRAEQRRQTRQTWTRILITLLAFLAVGSTFAWLFLANQDTRKALENTHKELEKAQGERDSEKSKKGEYVGFWLASERDKAKLEKEKTEISNNLSSQLRTQKQEDEAVIMQIQSKLRRIQQEFRSSDTEQIARRLGDLMREIEDKQKGTFTSGATASAQENERKGFDSLLQGELATARSYFANAYQALPTYGSVGDIYQNVLTQDLVDRYNKASSTEQQKIQRQVLKDIVEKYNWNVPPALLQQMKDSLQR